jgi:hypothetical protein
MANELSVVILFAIAAMLVSHGLQIWTRHARRQMVHKERLAAMEKGIDVPPLVEQELQRGSGNVQRLMLLAGLVWVSIGVATFATLLSLAGQPAFHLPWGREWTTGHPIWVEVRIRNGMEWIGLAPIGIGLSHLFVYHVGKRKEREEMVKP